MTRQFFVADHQTNCGLFNGRKKFMNINSETISAIIHINTDGKEQTNNIKSTL